MMETTRKEMGIIICSADAAQAMMKRFAKKEAEEVQHLMFLCGLAKNDKQMRDMYVEAVKNATGDNFCIDDYANKEHYRKAMKCKNSFAFAAKEIARHNSFVKRRTGLHFLTKCYDLSVEHECEELVEDFMVYATQICVEVYLNVANS